MTNLFVDERYVEGFNRLAVGIEPRDALTGRATAAPVDVRHERIPEPFDRWRRWESSDSLTQALPRFRRQRSGRFALLYDFDGDDNVDDVSIACRLDNVAGRQRPGRHRRFVPRRIRVEAPRRSEVEGAIDPAIAPRLRSLAVTLFPGAAAPIDQRATVARGRAVGPTDATGIRRPLRWCRVQAVDAVSNTELGWAHGDDRGEFALALGQVSNGQLNTPRNVRFRIGVLDPPPDPAALTDLRRSVDPLWDLPVEDFGAGPWPADGAQASGRSFLPEHAVVEAGTQQIPLGRATSLDIELN